MTASPHYHIQVCESKDIDYGYTFSRFNHALARCAVRMMEDDMIRKPLTCEGCKECEGAHVYSIVG